MKLNKLLPVALFLVIMLPAGFAHATPSFFSNYSEIYAVGAEGSTTFQPNFTLSQQPWIYIQLPAAFNNESTTATWTNPSTSTFNPIVPNTSTDQVWVSFSSSQWNTIKATGTWDTTEFSANPNNPSSPFMGNASFTVSGFKVNAAPEPVGTILFLVGAAIMGISIVRRRKVLAV